MYREVFVPVDNSDLSHQAVARAIELRARTGGRITGSHVYAARLHDVRFRQLETRRIDVSSTEIRERIRSGQSIMGFVPPEVAAYIASAGLYR